MNRHFGLPLHSSERKSEILFRQGILPRGCIDGLILSNDVTDPTNDIAITAGVARSTTRSIDGVASTLPRDQLDLELPVGIVKQLDVAFAPDNYTPEGTSGGVRSGGRSTSAISDTTWHVYLIGGTGLPTDVILHDGTSPPSLTNFGGYDASRRIGSIMRSGGVIRTFFQFGDEFVWNVPPLDLSAVAHTTTAQLDTITAPLGIVTEVTFNVYQSTNVTPVYVHRSPSITSAAASQTAVPLATVYATAGSGPVNATVQGRAFTNTSSQLKISTQAAGDVSLVTLGYRDTRGRDA